ncbi:MAG: hypothetical protein ACRDJE_22560 [Dehalococcoidia bacterium]
MPKPTDVQDPDLRALLTDAHRALREGDPAGAVHRCADAFLRLALLKPAVLQTPPGMRIHPFPRLGAMLVIEQDKLPTVEYHRETFSLSEAITYYEYTLGAATRNGA